MIITNESFTVDEYSLLLKEFREAQEHLTEALNLLQDEYKNSIVDDLDKEIIFEGYNDTKQLLDQIKEYIE